MKDIKIGDDVLFVSDMNDAIPMLVTSVGRKWIYFDGGYRMTRNGDNDPQHNCIRGMFFRNRAEYDEYLVKKHMFDLICHLEPRHMTAQVLQRMLNIALCIDD